MQGLRAKAKVRVLLSTGSRSPVLNQEGAATLPRQLCDGMARQDLSQEILPREYSAVKT